MAFKIASNSVFLGELLAHPDTPQAGEWVLYFMSDGLYIMDDAGLYTQVAVPNITRLAVSDGVVSNPPTDAELDVLLGTPAELGDGFVRILDNGGEDATVYLVVAKGDSWWYTSLASIALTLRVNTISSPQTITLQRITPTGDDCVIDWGDGTTTTVNDGNTNAITHEYANAGTYTLTFENPSVLTWIEICDDTVVGGNISGWALPSSLQHLALSGSNVSGDITGWVLPNSLLYLDLGETNVNGAVDGWMLPSLLETLSLNNTSLGGNIYLWTLPSTLIVLNLGSTNVSGSFGSLPSSLQYLDLSNSDDLWMSYALPTSLQYLNLSNNTVVSDVVEDWILPNSLQYLNLYLSSAGGNIEDWVLPSSLQYLDLGFNAVSGDISGWALPASLQYLNLHTTHLSGDIGGWVLPASLQYLNLNQLYSLSGNIGGWVLPASLQYLNLNQLFLLSGNIGNWVLPSPLQNLYLSGTNVNGAPDISSNTAIKNFSYSNCHLSQSDVDAVLQSIYNHRLAFTATAPALVIGGTNAAPSGTYQDADPPATGLEYVYELANDPESEGFNTWTITYTGGSVP